MQDGAEGLGMCRLFIESNGYLSQSGIWSLQPMSQTCALGKLSTSFSWEIPVAARGHCQVQGACLGVPGEGPGAGGVGSPALPHKQA